MNAYSMVQDWYVPDGEPVENALARTTHLGIGAHQDDLEFMAFHGIIECFHSKGKWFGGIICTDGTGSTHEGPYANSEEYSRTQPPSNFRVGQTLRLQRPSAGSCCNKCSTLTTESIDESSVTDEKRLL